MLNSLILCLLSIFAVFGFFCLLLLSCGKSLRNPPIVICTYNDEETVENDIKAAIKSYPGSEIIVVDLGSSDETERIIKILAADYKCIRFVERRTIKEKLIDKFPK